MSLKNQTGIVKNLFELETLKIIQKMFVEKLQRTDGISNDCYGLEKGHLLWPWFHKMFFSKIEQQFDENLQPIFVMYMNAIKPFEVHGDDYWHNEKKLPGNPFISFLVPISVDDLVDKINLASTIVFNENFYEGEKKDNAFQFFNESLSHCDPDVLKQLTIKNKFDWQVGDFIYWDSTLQHSSGHFKSFTSKQCLVGHTYIL